MLSFREAQWIADIRHISGLGLNVHVRHGTLADGCPGNIHTFEPNAESSVDEQGTDGRHILDH